MNRDREIAERLRYAAARKRSGYIAWELSPDIKPPDDFAAVLDEAADALTAASAGHQAEVEKARREENEACAAIAENLWVEARDTEFDDGVNTAKRVIAKAIRLGPFARLTVQEAGER